MEKEKQNISWSKIREDFRFNDEAFGRMTYYSNYFMRKGIFDLSDLEETRLFDLFEMPDIDDEDEKERQRIGLRGLAILYLLTKSYDISIIISEDEKKILEKDIRKTEEEFLAVKNKKEEKK